MNQEEAIQAIRHAARNRARELDLRGLQLSELPAKIGLLTNLRRLNLSANQLSNLPAEFSKLSNLEILDLSNNLFQTFPELLIELYSLNHLILMNNQLEYLPPSFRKLKNLRRLDLMNNRFKDLPVGVTELTQLEDLDLSGNRLTHLPETIGQLSNLERLTLTNNALRELPEEVGKLSNLDKLEIRQNDLVSIPSEIVHLFNLKTLDLSKNKLTSIPSVIGQLPNLKVLELQDNALLELPSEIAEITSLVSLNVSHNRLTTPPVEVSRLPNLISLEIAGNPLNIPPEILSRISNPQEIIRFYTEQQSSPNVEPLGEAKMLIVGQGGVGKTSLVRRLLDNTYYPYQDKTEGIDINKWIIPIDDYYVQLNIWDFGGQEIMHATHQFFLTHRSLYMLALDARQEETFSRIEYWLNLIQSYGGNSPIVVVVNKIDQQRLDLDRRGLKRKYPTIREFVDVSCATGEGIGKLRTVITEIVATLDHVHDTLRPSWIAVKKRLEAMEEDYIPYAEYVRICETENVTDDLDQATLIRFLHDLGTVLNFDDLWLENTNILNPEWLTGAVYSILNSHILFQSKGVLVAVQLQLILDPSRYPREQHRYILDLMKNFELCFPFDEGEKYLIPDLLPKEEPDLNWPYSESLQFQYRYNFLPNSVISRFIVKAHQFISKHTYWRSGVVLAYGNNKALVKADAVDNKIYIAIIGDERKRREFLAVIRLYLGQIHHSIENLEAKEKVPLREHRNVVVDYEHLINLEDLNIEWFIPEGLLERVSVQELLEGVDTRTMRENRQASRESEMQSRVRSKLVTNASSTPMVLEPEESQVSEDLVSYITLQAEQYATNIYRFYLFLNLLVWLIFLIQIILIGWGAIEPVITLLVGIAGLGPSFYFAWTRQEWSPKVFHEQVKDWRKAKLLEAARVGEKSIT